MTDSDEPQTPAGPMALFVFWPDPTGANSIRAIRPVKLDGEKRAGPSRMVLAARGDVVALTTAEFDRLAPGYGGAAAFAPLSKTAAKALAKAVGHKDVDTLAEHVAQMDRSDVRAAQAGIKLPANPWPPVEFVLNPTTGRPAIPLKRVG